VETGKYSMKLFYKVGRAYLTDTGIMNRQGDLNVLMKNTRPGRFLFEKWRIK